jgi:lipopolysaccharide exporter
MSIKQKTASGIFWTGIATLSSVIIQFLQLSILARLLDPSDFGIMAMIMVIIGFANAFADMGVSNAIIHHQNIQPRQLSSLYWLSVLSGISICLIIIVSIPWIIQFFREPRLAVMLQWASLIFVVTPFGQQFQILFQKGLQFKYLAIVEILAAIAGSIIAIIAAIQGKGVLSLVWGQLAVSLFRSILLAYRGWRNWQPMMIFDIKSLQKFLGFSLYQMAERSINYGAWNLDKLLVGKILGSSPLGFYNIAYQLMVRPFMVLNPIMTKVAFPVFASIQDDNERLRRGYIKMSQWIALINTPIYLGMLVMAEPLIALLLGPKWGPSVAVLQILSGLGILYSLGNPLGSLLLAKGRADLGFWMNVLGIIVYGLAVLVGSRWDSIGVAWSLLLSNLFLLLPIDYWLRWYLVNLHPGEYLKRIFPSLMLAFCMMLGMLYIRQALPPYPLWLELGIPIMFGGLFYGVGNILFQRALLKDVLTLVRNTG